MPKGSKAESAPSKEKKPLKVFLYPSVGDGVSVKATSQEEADEKIASLLKDMEARDSSPATDG